MFIFLFLTETYYIYKIDMLGQDFDGFKSFIKDVLVTKKYKIEYGKYFNVILNTISVDKYYSCLYSKQFVPGAFTQEFRPDENVNSDKPPVLFMGCSFTWGDGLEKNETISSQFAKLIDRPTYNRAGMGWGLAQ